ncbi:unnamed protein product, partial [Prorocentrum cordatum]
PFFGSSDRFTLLSGIHVPPAAMGKAQRRLTAKAATAAGHYLAADRTTPELKYRFETGLAATEPVRDAMSKATSTSTTPCGSTPREYNDSASDSDAHPPMPGLLDVVVHFAPARGCHRGAPGVHGGAALASASPLRGPPPGPAAAAARCAPPGTWHTGARPSPEPLAAPPPARRESSGLPPSAQGHDAARDSCWAAARAPRAPPGSWEGKAGRASAPLGLEGPGALPGSWRCGPSQSPAIAAIGPPPGLEARGPVPRCSEVGAAGAGLPAVPPGSWAVRPARPGCQPPASEPPPGLAGAPRHAVCIWQL